MKNEDIILDELRTRCAELQALIFELKNNTPKSIDDKSIEYLKRDLMKIKREIHGKVYDYRLAQLDKEIESYDE